MKTPPSNKQSNNQSNNNSHNKSYQLLDSGNFEKLEQAGPFRIRRPAPSAVWSPRFSKAEWANVDAHFVREKDNGEWNIKNQKLKEEWDIEIQGITFHLKLTSFGHLGIFPEQLSNWKKIEEICLNRVRAKKSCKVLNLFAYTGGSTLFCAKAGAEVTHVDASRGSVNWASQNAQLSGLGEAKTRWIVDDVNEFVAREIRRGSKYDGIILDPPSYGRGSKNQIWKIEEHLGPYLLELKKVMSDDFSFLLLSSHTPGYTPISLRNQLSDLFPKGYDFIAEEMLIAEKAGRDLPSGTYCMAINKG
jgi:23S rRNA (cytosine1962-C5)-methyltransferase